MRYFDEEEKKEHPSSIGIRGTAWLLSPSVMVTAEHVSAAMRLSDHEWKQLEIVDENGRRSLAARLLPLAESRAEKMAMLEVDTPLPGARGLQIRMQPLAPDERVVSVAYPGGRLRFAAGRFVEYGQSDNLAGAALFELYDGDDRLVLDHGASGAPVLDCDGRVVAVVNNLFTQSLQFLSRTVRISTAWGSANVVSIPIQALRDF